MKARFWAGEVALHCAVVALTVVILVLAFRIRPSALATPMAWSGDAIYTQVFLLNYLETGNPLASDRTGAPFGTDLTDFPIAEAVHLAVLRGLACSSRDPNWLVNVFYFLGFPLTAVTSLLSLRALGVGRPAAVLGGVLYTFLPWHYFRFGHLFLASYYLVPLIVLTAVWVCQGPLSRGRWVASILIALLASGGGVYYAFFGCFFLLVGGVARAARERRPVCVLPAVALVVVITAGLFAQVAPAALAQMANGKNPDVAVRQPFEADMYGLRIIYLLLPVRNHQFGPFGHVFQTYTATSPFGPGEAGGSALGLVGAAGLVGLIAYFLFVPARDNGTLGHTLGMFTLAGLLLGTVTGFAYLFAYFVTPKIRCYNRVSVFLAFFALAAVCVVADLLFRRAKERGRLGQAGAYLAGTLVLAAGVLDQSPRPFFRPRPPQVSAAAPVQEFVAKIEAALPPDSMILQLPIVSFPESQGVLGTTDYDHFRPSTCCRSLRWSHGVVRGRYPDAVFAALGRKPVEQQVEQAALMGYGGIHLDRDGYPERGAAVVEQLRRLLGVEPIACDNGRDLFFDLRPWADQHRQRVGATAWRELERDVGQPTEVAVWSGSTTLNPGDPERRRLFVKGQGAVELYNPLDVSRVVTLRFDVAAPGAEGAEFRLSGELLAATRGVGTPPVEVRHQVTVPPGKHRVAIDCTLGGKPALFQVARFDVVNQPLSAGKGVARQGGE